MSDLLILQVSSASLVFGLHWLPLISGRASRAAHHTARRHRASHVVVSGDGARAVGLAALKPERGRRTEPFHSAAQNVACLHAGGTVALLLELQPACYWLVAVHEGAVVARTDKLYSSRAEAGAVLDELKQAYPQLQVMGDQKAPVLPTLPMIAAASTVQTQLAPVSRWNPVFPAPVQWFALALVLVFVIPRLWPVLRQAGATAVPAAVVDPVSAWQQAVSKATRHVTVHGVQGTQLLLHSLYTVPVRMDGWGLVDVNCVAQLSAWRCRARYDRRDARASNEHFLAKAASQWAVEFESIDRANAVWVLPAAGLPLAAHALKTSADNERHLFSSLQSIRPVFTQMQLGKPQAVKIEPPRDEKNYVIERPAHIPGYLTRPVQIQGPLRSVSLLLPYTESLSWKQVLLSVRHVDRANATSSRLNVSFQGDLYEIESTANRSASPGPLEPDPPGRHLAAAS
jgi:hypothetical protein